jgi:hypothetical protein
VRVCVFVCVCVCGGGGGLQEVSTHTLMSHDAVVYQGVAAKVRTPQRLSLNLCLCVHDHVASYLTLYVWVY